LGTKEITAMTSTINGWLYGHIPCRIPADKVDADQHIRAGNDPFPATLTLQDNRQIPVRWAWDGRHHRLFAAGDTLFCTLALEQLLRSTYPASVLQALRDLVPRLVDQDADTGALGERNQDIAIQLLLIMGSHSIHRAGVTLILEMVAQQQRALVEQAASESRSEDWAEHNHAIDALHRLVALLREL
jgi:hypothetical protein